MLIEKGQVTPELTEAMLGVYAPDTMARVRGNATEGLPEDVQRVMDLARGVPAAETPATEEQKDEVAPPPEQEPQAAPDPGELPLDKPEA